MLAQSNQITFTSVPFIWQLNNISLLMKKLQLKIPANKNRLQINRGKHDIFLSGDFKAEPFKANLSINGKLQSKEEKTSKVQLLPALHGSPSCQPAGLDAPKADGLQTKKKISVSLQPGKHKEIRRSASIDMSKDSDKLKNEKEDLSEAIKELLRLFQHRKIRKSNGHGAGPSSTDSQSVLRYIITSKNIREISNRSFSKNRLKQEPTHDSIFGKSRKSLFAGDMQSSNKGSLKICQKSVDIAYSGGEIGERKIAEMREEFTRLRGEKTSMEEVVQNLKQRVQEQMRVVKEFQQQKQGLSEEIIRQSARLQDIKHGIEENGTILAKMEAKRYQIETFVHSQPNRIVKEASQYHRNLEIDLFQFADYLRHHPLGKKDFQPSIYYDQIQRMMGIELQQMIKCLSEDKKQQLDEKCEHLLKFLEKLKHQYKLMNNELYNVIEQKTKYIEKYSSIMFLWYQNYLTKKEYLSHLKEGFSLEVMKIEEGKRKITEIEKNSNCSSCVNTKNQTLKVMESLKKVVELFSLGNSFY